MTQFGEPGPRGGGRGNQLAGAVDHNKPRRVDRRSLRRADHEQPGPQPFREMRGQGSDELLLLVGEALAGLAMQTHQPPARVTGSQYSA